MENSLRTIVREISTETVINNFEQLETWFQVGAKFFFCLAAKMTCSDNRV